MRFYRIAWAVADKSELAVDWATNSKDANRIARESSVSSVDIIEIEPTKAGILAALKAHSWR